MDARFAAEMNVEVEFRVPLSYSAVDSHFLPFGILVSPGHAWRVVRDAEASALVQQDHAAVAVEPLFQILHCFLRYGIWRAPVRTRVGQPT